MITLLVTILAVSLCFITAGALLNSGPVNKSSSKKSTLDAFNLLRKTAVYRNHFVLHIKIVVIWIVMGILCIILFIFIIWGLQKPDILRDPIWQFVGVVISFVSLIVSIIPSMLKSKRVRLEAGETELLFPNKTLSSSQGRTILSDEEPKESCENEFEQGDLHHLMWHYRPQRQVRSRKRLPE